MRVRPNTWDGSIAASILNNNEYELPESMAGQVVLDIGAHIGSFALACQKRGARKIVCYEPDVENASILVINMDEVAEPRSDITVHNCAVMGLAYDDLGIRHLTEHDFGQGRNTGHVDVFGDADDTMSVAIDDAITDVGEPIDVLKLDCEGAEWEIFDTANFENVHSIVAELHDVPKSKHRSLAPYKGLSRHQLADRARMKLMGAGFNVSVVHETLTSKLMASRSVAISADKKPVMLWIGDAAITTGYARVTERICTHLVKCGWEVHVIGVGYNGDPHRYPYKIYPAVDSNVGGHRNGLTRLREVAARVKPDICVIQDDSWNVGIITDNMALLNIAIPTVGYVAIDSENVRKETGVQLRNLRHAICHTNFGVEQLRLAGYTGPASVAPHGVDTSIYTPYSHEDARAGIPIPHGHAMDAFIWGVVGQNQPRKRLDLSIAYWAAWWRQAGEPDNAYLYIHTMPDGTWDTQQLAEYLGIKGRVFGTEGGQILKDIEMPSLYNAFDVCISMSEGESFGIPLIESQACGVPNIAVDCGGAPSWAGDTIYWVKPSYYQYTINRINTKRWIASEADYVKAMQDMYTNPALRADYAKRGLELARKMTWEIPGDHFDAILRKVLNAKKAVMASKDALAEF